MSLNKKIKYCVHNYNVIFMQSVLFWTLLETISLMFPRKTSVLPDLEALFFTTFYSIYFHIHWQVLDKTSLFALLDEHQCINYSTKSFFSMSEPCKGPVWKITARAELINHVCSLAVTITLYFFLCKINK